MRRSARESLVSLWPSLRYLSLGVLLAWMYLVVDFGAWMTDTDSVNLSVIDVSMRVYGVSAVVMLLAAWQHARCERLLSMRHANACIAALAMLGAALLIASGPAFLQVLGLSGMFLAGSVMIGVAAGLMFLRVAQLYCALPSSRTLLYAIASELLVAVLFYIVAGNAWLAASSSMPAPSYLLAVLALPAVAMGLASLPAADGDEDAKGGEGGGAQRADADAQGQPISIGAFVKALPMVGKLMLVIFVFSAVVFVVRNLFMIDQAPTAHQLDAQQAMLLRMLFAACLLVFAALFTERVPLGKVYLFGMVAISLVAAMLPLFSLNGSFLLACTCTLLNIVNLTIWCLLAFVAEAGNFPPPLVFGLGKGLSHAGAAIGYALGYYGALSALRNDDGSIASPLIAAMIVLVVVCIAIIFTEKDFDAVLEASGASQLNVREAILRQKEGRHKKKDDRPWQRACWAVGERYLLSKREQELLEELSRNRSPQEIAARLNITVATVRTHTHHVYTKLDVHSRDELVELVREERERL